MLKIKKFVFINNNTTNIEIEELFEHLNYLKSSNKKIIIVFGTEPDTKLNVKIIHEKFIELGSNFEVEIVEINTQENNNKNTINFIDLRKIDLNNLEEINLNNFDKNKKIKIVDKFRSSPKIKKMTSILNMNGFYNIEYLEVSIIQ